LTGVVFKYNLMLSKLMFAKYSTAILLVICLD